jgi:hypothetical protein
MHQFAMDFVAQFVKDANGQVRFIVTAFVTEARSEPLAMVDRFCVQRETLSNPVPDRNAAFDIEVKRLQSHFWSLQTNLPTTLRFPTKLCRDKMATESEQY